MAAAVPFIMMAVSAAGAYYQGEQQRQNNKANAEIANWNAAQAKQAGDAALREASANEDAQRRKSAGELSRQTAALAESGMGLDSGTSLDVTEQSALNAEMDALNIRYAGQTKAKALYTQGVNFQNQAAISSANASKTGVYIGAASAALSSYGRYGMGGGGGLGGGGGGS